MGWWSAVVWSLVGQGDKTVNARKFRNRCVWCCLICNTFASQHFQKLENSDSEFDFGGTCNCRLAIITYLIPYAALSMKKSKFVTCSISWREYLHYHMSSSPTWTMCQNESAIYPKIKMNCPMGFVSDSVILVIVIFRFVSLSI